MKYHGVSIYTGDFYKFTMPQVYSDGEWKQGTCYIYKDNEWQLIGGACTNMVYFYDKNGNLVHDNTGGYYLVREPWGGDIYGVGLIDANEIPLADITGADLYEGGN